jgi:hypothetical protein
MATGTRPRRSRGAAALGAIELTGTESIARYADTARAEFRDLAMELDLTATDLARRLAVAASGRRPDFAARMAARRAVRRLRKAAEHATAAGDDARRFFRDYEVQFATLIHPERARESWRWSESGTRPR